MAQVQAFEAMEADARVAVDLEALCAHVDALARCGRMADAAAQAERAAAICQRQGAAPALALNAHPPF